MYRTSTNERVSCVHVSVCAFVCTFMFAWLAAGCKCGTPAPRGALVHPCCGRALHSPPLGPCAACGVVGSWVVTVPPPLPSHCLLRVCELLHSATLHSFLGRLAPTLCPQLPVPLFLLFPFLDGLACPKMTRAVHSWIHSCSLGTKSGCIPSLDRES